MRRTCVWPENWRFGPGNPRGHTEQFKDQHVIFISARFKVV